MDNLLTVAFEAHHPERNHHRRYEVRVGRDLFDDWTVTIRYGRVGRADRSAATAPRSGRRCRRSSATACAAVSPRPAASAALTGSPQSARLPDSTPPPGCPRTSWTVSFT